ncbi:MAG: hypothetical protein JJU11_02825 [Candidatus Sumerlaeia bacterium]|nr:hypothetical protein [Candidatus Sumerlaeia bacterium]
MATTTSTRSSLIDRLQTEGLIDQEQKDRILEEYDRSKRSVIRILQDTGVLSEDLRIDFLHRQYKTPVVKLDNVTPRSDVVGFMTRDMCRLHHVVPIRRDGSSVLIAMEDPTDMALLADLEKVFDANIKPVLATSDEISDTIERLPEVETAITAPPKVESTGHKLLSTFSLVLLAFTPMILSFYFININAYGREWYASLGFSQFETGLVFLISWGSWAAIAYFINDLIFGVSNE